MSEYDADGYYPHAAGHQWRDNRGPESHCAREGCGQIYAQWSGDRCWKAPDCQAKHPLSSKIFCDLEAGHEYTHTAYLEWP